MLMHELIHIEHGHNSHQPPQVERIVESETAKRLLPCIETVARNLADVDIATAAEALWVTPNVLHTRLNSLTREEHAFLHQRGTEICLARLETHVQTVSRP